MKNNSETSSSKNQKKKAVAMDFSDSFVDQKKKKKVQKPKLSSRHESKKPKNVTKSTKSVKKKRKKWKRGKFRSKKRWTSPHKTQPTVIDEFLCKTKNGKTIKISVVWGDITLEKVDIVTNAANGRLAHVGGVARAISFAAGREIQVESDRIIKNLKVGKRIKPGNIAVTSGKFIIHAVGPIYINGRQKEERNLRNVIKNALKEANKLKVKSISLPCISSGIFRYPKKEAVSVITSEIVNFITNCENCSLENIRLTNFDKLTSDLFKKKLKEFEEEKLVMNCREIVEIEEKKKFETKKDE